MNISAPARYPSGKRKPGPEPRHPGHHTLWRRLRDNWDEIVKTGGNPMWGTVVGKLYLAGVLTEIEARAARFYAEVAGRFDRYHGITRRSVASPAYQAGRNGSDDEVVRHEKNGTIGAYEKKAKKIKKAWERVQACLLTASARDVVETVCLYDQEVAAANHAQLKVALSLIARRFGLFEIREERKAIPQRGAPLVSDTEKRVVFAVNSLERWFADQGGTVASFWLLEATREGERGLVVYGSGKDGAPLQRVASIKQGKALPVEVDNLILKTVLSKGWVEISPEDCEDER